MIISHMIKFKKSVLELKTVILDKLWIILEIMKRHAIEEDMRIREETLDNIIPICSHDEKAILLDLVKPHLRTKTRNLQIMNKEYEQIGKETEKAFAQVIMDSHMYPSTMPTTKVTLAPPKQVTEPMIQIAPMTGPQVSGPSVLITIDTLKDSEDTIMVDNIKISMTTSDNDMDKVDKTFVSTKDMCTNDTSVQQDEVPSNDAIELNKEKDTQDDKTLVKEIPIKNECMDTSQNTIFTPSTSLLSRLTPDSTSLDAWGEEDLMKIIILAMENAKENQVMRNPLFLELINILNDLVPANKKVAKIQSVEDVDSILTSFKAHFTNLVDSTTRIIEDEYKKERLNELVKNFTLDLKSLKIGQSILKELAAKGKKVIANCMDRVNFTSEHIKKIEETEIMVDSIRKLVETSMQDMNISNNVY